MHAVIINGSPRVQNHSNTNRILRKFIDGFCEAGNTFELYSLSDTTTWDFAREAYEKNDNIIFALPLYVECVPGLMMEFLETLPSKNKDTKLSFILQSGFAEGLQLRCGEAYLKILTERLNCGYGGAIVKGDNFGIRFAEGEEVEKLTEPYKEIGKIFGEEGDFFNSKCVSFTGPEILPWLLRVYIGIYFKTGAKKNFEHMAKSWGCEKPIEYKPW